MCCVGVTGTLRSGKCGKQRNVGAESCCALVMGVLNNKFGKEKCSCTYSSPLKLMFWSFAIEQVEVPVIKCSQSDTSSVVHVDQSHILVVCGHELLFQFKREVAALGASEIAGIGQMLYGLDV